MSAKKQENWLEQAIALARTFAEGYPSDAQRDEALKVIDGMIHELQKIRDHLNALPSESERRRVADAALAMEQFLDSMRARPAIALAMGLGVPRMSTNLRAPRELPLVEDQQAMPLARGREEIVAAIAELEQLSTIEIQNRLLDETKFSLSRLQNIARQLGLPVERGRDRLDLVDRIVKLGFANKRGSEILGRPRKVAQ
ncbi:MAG TPA: hypothetical protein PK156_01745 [Polyangium sp.]|nr:hypothetical protein [Polyangium sp.]